MEKTISFRPVLWRLIFSIYVPFYIGWTLGGLVVDGIKNHPPDLLFLAGSAITIMIIDIILCLNFRKKYNIVISDTSIIGPALNIYSPPVEILIESLDSSYFHKQSLYEKISGYHTVRALNGRKIIVLDFVYQKHAAREIYELLARKYLQIFNRS